MTQPGATVIDDKAQLPDLREVVVILAPRGRDADVASGLITRAGIATRIVASIAELVSLLDRNPGVILLTEEAIAVPVLPTLQAALEAQAAWSDVPFIVLANGASGARSMLASSRMDMLRNAVLLSRPLHSEELLRAVRSALKARQRQYEARDHLEALRLRELQLRESEAKFHAIANSVDQMIWSTRPDGYHDYYNARWYEFTGVPPGSTDGEEWNGMFHPDDRDRAWEAWRHALATGEPYEIEYRLRHRSGAYRWVLGRASAVRGDDGRIQRWYGSCTDIHDEVIARETQVSDLTRQRDQAWNLSLDLMMVAATDGRLLVLNEAWTRILGWPHAALLGARLQSFVHPDDAERIAAVLDAIAVTKKVDPFEIRLTDASDGFRWFEWTATENQGQIFAVGRDVTERREKDIALARAEEALRQSQKLEMIGQLTGGVAHDFNNLLMAIRSSLSLAKRRSSADPGITRFLDNAIAATDRGAGLTQRMLAFARQQELKIGAAEIGVILPGLRDLLERSLGPEIEIAIDVPGGLPKLKADVNQLEMAILNLAVNARDAMNGVGQLRISARAVDASVDRELAAGCYIEIAVHDNGIGMDAATLERAMEPFFTTKGVGKGTGLGLSMVHGLAKQSGGAFRLASAPQQGTKASIYLPCVGEGEDATPAEAAAQAGVGAAPHRKERLTVLAVDDDILVSMGTVGILEDLGHEVIEAHSGAKALEVIAVRSDIDLLITDQAMPRMTGIELARKVREIRPDLPIVLATGYSDMPDATADLISTKLDKPFSDSALIGVLSDLFGT